MTEREIFLEALEMSTPEARAAYLKGACAGDVALQRKVVQLLEEHFANDSLLAGSALAVDRPGIVKSPVEEAPARMIGRYKLLEKVGEGGFGEVWMAEQREPVKRRVALKIIKLGMDSRQVVARFEAERQALAMMDHANIARIFDADVTDSGRPYFVMELVRGLKITEYCDQKELPTRERLDLFIKVCHAIQHAHQKGIIHRDIKPSNILVTLHDGVPVPKVIDFGIAKATQQELTDKTLFTQFQQFIGTPAYISPEQAEMSGLDIDTRADIYSLGVLLYELLVGQTPFDAKEMVKGGIDALRQIIREKEPQRPSTKLSTLQGEARTTAGKRRQTDVGRLVHQLEGDLDWIVMKCLEKDRQRRYETANGLAADIQRHMNNEPVLARPPSRLYEFQKTVRRHKIGFAAAGGVLLALAIASWALVKEKRARERADNAEQEQKRQRQIAESKEKQSEQVAQFLKDMLNGVAPSVALGRDTRLLKEILDQTAERVGRDLKDQPEVEAELRSTIGDVYREAGEYRKSETMHRDALAIRRTLWGDEDARVAASLEGVGRALWKKRRLVEAKDALQEALAIRRKLLGNNHPDVASSLNNLGRLSNLESKFVESERYHLEALAILRQQRDGDRTAVADTLIILARAKQSLGKLQEAEDAVREALALLEDQHASTRYAAALSRWGVLLEEQGRLPEAEAADRQSQAVFRQILGNESPELGAENVSLARVLVPLAGRPQLDQSCLGP